MTRTVAVVGAGVAGVGVADALRETDAAVTLFDKGRGISGRAATRRKHGCRYDHGANYIKPGEDAWVDDLLDELGTDGLADIEEPVWTHDADGTIAEGRDDESHKWTYVQGITQFAKRVRERADAPVHKSTRVESIDRDEDGWHLTDTDGEDYGPFDVLVLTPPAPQTADLLADTDWADDRLARLHDAVDAVPYRTIRTLVLHYPFELDRPWYALVNPDREHPVGWLSREECKPGHVPDGESLLVAQMSPGWSVDHYDDPAEDAAAAAADLVATLLDDDRLTEPDWVDSQGWRYALPDAAVDAEAARCAEDAGLFVAGDWVVGEGRVHRAFENGRTVGARVADHLA
ncbi:NAD(P)/FAD-dependent oxidoreductase [Haloarchaeobius amylolyticus]|uniref:NAD(P)/FAD-dependent oxidoreductase n=1 Tax=Haloarchaeobius amylolyticus TaxID=1198296 RepID=UPI00226DEAB0|nr:FAD-dependent oxidoreductase [Haloarchaeobius amylolyticus]